MNRTPARSDRLRWARQRLTYNAHALAGRFPKLEDLDVGEVQSTLKQSGAFATSTARRWSFYFSPSCRLGRSRPDSSIASQVRMPTMNPLQIESRRPARHSAPLGDTRRREPDLAYVAPTAGIAGDGARRDGRATQ